jgi:hypothetical protein
LVRRGVAKVEKLEMRQFPRRGSASSCGGSGRPDCACGVRYATLPPFSSPARPSSKMLQMPLHSWLHQNTDSKSLSSPHQSQHSLHGSPSGCESSPAGSGTSPGSAEQWIKTANTQPARVMADLSGVRTLRIHAMRRAFRFRHCGIVDGVQSEFLVNAPPKTMHGPRMQNSLCSIVREPTPVPPVTKR